MGASCCGGASLSVHKRTDKMDLTIQPSSVGSVGSASEPSTVRSETLEKSFSNATDLHRKSSLASVSTSCASVRSDDDDDSFV